MAWSMQTKKAMNYAPASKHFGDGTTGRLSLADPDRNLASERRLTTPNTIQKLAYPGAKVPQTDSPVLDVKQFTLGENEENMQM